MTLCPYDLPLLCHKNKTMHSKNLIFRISGFVFLSMLLGALTFSSLDKVPEKTEDISPLLYGETIPEVSVQGMDGQKVSLLEKVGEKPTILIFYRGGWCPFCNTQLSGIQRVKENLDQMGYQILAISPDTPDNLSKTIDKNDLSYTLLSDTPMEASKAFGIAFKLPDEKAKKYQEKGLSLGGEDKNLLPVPTVMVLDQKGKILFEYINPNYRERLKPELLEYAAKLALAGE